MPRAIVYALTTCVHCKQAMKFLADLNVEYESVFVDTLDGEQRKATIAELKKHNPAASFPTLVIDGDRVVLGFRKDEIEEALGL